VPSDATQTLKTMVDVQVTRGHGETRLTAVAR